MPRDNILLITTDQQRFDTINALGNRSIFTPHLNYLASMGVAFTRCYADCPICVPSRTTIMTGMRGFESGVVSNATHEAVMRAQTVARATLPAILTDAGYQTKAMGKMHFAPARALRLRGDDAASRLHAPVRARRAAGRAQGVRRRRMRDGACDLSL